MLEKGVFGVDGRRKGSGIWVVLLLLMRCRRRGRMAVVVDILDDELNGLLVELCCVLLHILKRFRDGFQRSP